MTAKMLQSMLWLEVHYNPTSRVLCIASFKHSKVYYLGDVEKDHLVIEFPVLLRGSAKVGFVIGQERETDGEVPIGPWRDYYRAHLYSTDDDAPINIPVHIFTPANGKEAT